MAKIKMNVRRGAIEINNYWTEAGSVRSGFLAIGIDLKAKHAELGGTAYHANGVPEIYLDKGEETLYVSRSTLPTSVYFPTLKGWTVWSATVSQYTVRICMLKQKPM